MNRTRKDDVCQPEELAKSKSRQGAWSLAETLSVVILAVGILLRLLQWLNNRSLWLDEAMLARNIIDRSPFELLTPLDYNQGAPVLFLLFVDTTTKLFGSSELALRLIPLLSSLIGLVIFFLVARLFLETRYIPIALFLFAFSYELVYYAQELKQYSIDVTIAIALTYYFLRVSNSNAPRKVDLICLGVLGGLGTFLSHPSLFVMASIASTLIILKFYKKLSIPLCSLSLIFSSWIVCFGANYIFFLKPISMNKDLLNYWKGDFLPLPTSVDALMIWWETARSFLLYIGFPAQWHGVVLVLGAVALASGIRNKSAPMLMSAMCFFFAIGCSIAGKYPFSGRLVLYLIPLLILIVVRGLQAISNGRPAIVYCIMTIALLVPSSMSLPNIALHPIQREEVRPLLEYLNSNRKSGDQVYVYYAASDAINYYLRNETQNSNSDFWHFGRASRNNRATYIEDIHAMRKWPRVWFIFSHLYSDEEYFFIAYTDGILLDKKTEHGASLYLYQFRQSVPKMAAQTQVK
jgi:hypothetical protein